MNLKTTRLLVLLIVSTFVYSCSSDDDSGNEPTGQNNEFSFNGQSYSLTTAWIYDENTTTNDPSEIGINLFNKTNSEINGIGDLNSINHIYFDFDDVNIQATTYTQITDYDVSINGTRLNGAFDSGTVLLSDSDPQSNLYASSGSITINSVTENTVDLTFTFTRTDGEIISGSYNGNYTVPE